MKYFIADASILGLRRLLMLLDNKKVFELVGYSGEVQAAIISILNVHPQVVILDLNMRGMNGIEVLKAVKPERPEIIFMIVTNSATPQYRRHAHDLGAEYFFDKSTEFGLIPAALQHIADRLKKTEQSNSDAGINKQMPRSN